MKALLAQVFMTDKSAELETELDLNGVTMKQKALMATLVAIFMVVAMCLIAR